MNTLTLKDLPDNGEQRQQPAVNDYAIVDEYWRHHRRAVAGTFGSQHVSVDSGTTQTVFMYTA